MTPEQQEAQEALHRAVVQHVAAFRPEGSDPSREMISDWIVVAGVVSFNEEGERLTAYNLAYSDGEMDEHRAVGLLHVGQRLMMDGERLA